MLSSERVTGELQQPPPFVVTRAGEARCAQQRPPEGGLCDLVCLDQVPTELRCRQLHRLSGIPTHVVVPSVSLAAVVQGLAGTVLVDTPSSAGTERPVRDCGVGATWPEGKAPVLPPITPPEVGGLAAGDVGATCF
jgi:hypothetical protein